ncbi:hypothetical protein HS041_28020 [Planomonospora sp. ID67723]|uniref:hypothetical protein n=1 Tax=Planomonospora sp. ID67723 TaxID=2738134 RepID=UPI0018C38746|nr:hypothetical protein [Planomonospora sp. ID67723]MBG0831584.1 hypothetical protein [Planomonospora sp. ID67723]
MAGLEVLEVLLELAMMGIAEPTTCICTAPIALDWYAMLIFPRCWRIYILRREGMGVHLFSSKEVQGSAKNNK